MKKRIFITGAEVISPLGNTIDQIYDNLMLEKRQLLEPINYIHDFNFYQHNYKVLTRVDLCGQFCIHTVAQVVKDTMLIENDQIGLITVSKYGCINSQKKYLEQLNTLSDPQYASPRDFVQSICNIPNSHAAIELGIEGFCNHFVGGAEASLMALWQAAKCIDMGMVKNMIVGAFDTVCEQQREYSNFNHASEVKLCESAASLELRAESTINGDKKLFELLGWGFANHSDIGNSLKIAINKTLKNCRVSTNNIDFVISNANTLVDFIKNEEEALKEVFCRAIPTLVLKEYLGECMAAFPYIAISILDKLYGNYLLNNLIDKSNNDISEFLCYKNVKIKDNGIFLLIGYDEYNVSVTCLQYCKEK